MAAAVDTTMSSKIPAVDMQPLFQHYTKRDISYDSGCIQM